MYNKLHDGPTHLPTGPRNYQALPKTKPHASLAALQWAADCAGQSYGLFTLNLTPEEETRIQSEFETYKRERAVTLAERRVGLVDATPVMDELIISDNDR